MRITLDALRLLCITLIMITHARNAVVRVDKMHLVRTQSSSSVCSLSVNILYSVVFVVHLP